MFSIPVNKITVEDDSGTEVDETLYTELSTVNGFASLSTMGMTMVNKKTLSVLYCINHGAAFIFINLN